HALFGIPADAARGGRSNAAGNDVRDSCDLCGGRYPARHHGHSTSQCADAASSSGARNGRTRSHVVAAVSHRYRGVLADCHGAGDGAATARDRAARNRFTPAGTARSLRKQESLDTIMDTINETFLFYGYAAAWIIVFAFILILVRRGQRIDHELKRLKSLMEEKDK